MADGERGGAWLAGEVAAALPLTYLFIRLLDRHWRRCDIGVNAAANSFTLLFLVAPAMFVALAVAGIGAHLAAWRIAGRRGVGAPVAALLGMALVFGAGYAASLRMSADYPGPTC